MTRKLSAGRGRGQVYQTPRAILIALALLAPPASGRAADAGASPWQAGGHARVRLLALGPGPGGAADRTAAVEITLDPGYLTYWRNPGEAGLPPTFDTGASRNVASVAVDYPAPQTFDEGGTMLFGYRDAVTFPLRLTLADASRPATLDVALGFAVCAAICLPGRAALSLELPATSDPAVAQAIAAAQARVPRRTTLGGAGPLAVTRIDPVEEGGKPGFRVAARADGPATLYVEAPEGWFLSAGAPVPGPDGTLQFRVSIDDRPSSPAPEPIGLRLTLVAPTGAIEVPARVDAGAAKP